MTDRRRVVVTGMGMVSALGNDVATTWAGLVAGRSGIRTIEAFDPSRLTSRMAGEVRDFDASGVLDRKDMRRIDRYIQFGLVAAREVDTPFKGLRYIAAYVPELADLAPADRHEPWLARARGADLGGYPEPIVDHAHEREEALRRYAARRDPAAGTR